MRRGKDEMTDALQSDANLPDALQPTRLAAIWRYPVKSMHGEPLREATLAARGVDGDRRFAFESSGAPPGMLRLTGAGRREWLRCRARIVAGGKTRVRTPDGKMHDVRDAALLESLSRQLADGHTLTLTESSVPQTDCRPVSLISNATIAHLAGELGHALDPRRFRANFYLDGERPFWEDALVGRTVRIGAQATLRVLERDPRCRFITLDPDTTEPLPGLMKLLDRFHQGRAGVYAAVVCPGPVAHGDLVRLLD